jgi:hypothetical protein
MEDFNYFNYYTEIEEYFWRKRGAHVLVSPLDWAIVETWQKAGIPLEAVLAGIDRAFESYQRSRRAQAGRPLKTLVYCVDAVLDAAAEAREASAGKGPDAGRGGTASDLFSPKEVAGYFDRNIAQLHRASEKARAADPGLADRFEKTAGQLAERRAALEGDAGADLEDLERWLTVLEEKLTAAITTAAPEEMMVEIRRELDRALAPYRRKMTAEQLSLLERQYLQKRLLERFGLPRLSLFYLT